MTFATVSPQGALLRPCSPSSPNNRNRHLHFHVNTQSSNYISGNVSQISYPVLSILPTSITLQSIPRSSSGHYFPPSAIILHPDIRQQPPQSILILPGSARSRIREHQALCQAETNGAAETVTGNGKKDSPTRSARSVTISKTMAAAVATSPASSANTPQHGYYNQHSNHQHYHYQQGDRSSPTVIVTGSTGQNHYTPPRLLPQTVTGSANNIIQVRTVQKPIEGLLVDGENPFRPEGKLYKEAEEEIVQWTRPVSASPSPLPDTPSLSKEELDNEFPLLAHHHHSISPTNHVIEQHHTSVSTGPTSGKDERSKSVTSSSSSAPSHGQQINENGTFVKEDETDTKENIPPTVVREVVDTENNVKLRERDENRLEPLAPTRHDADRKDTVVKKPKKNKRKPVGCGGDKRCVIA